MKDKDGFNIRCKNSDWRIIDARDNKDFVCNRFRETGVHICYADDHCKYYKPDIKPANGFSDYPDMPYQFDNMTGSMNL